jgi:hypothetical protein
MQRIKRVTDVKSSIKPVRVSLEKGSDGVGEKGEARRRQADLDGPWGATRLGGRARVRGGGGRLEEGSELLTVLRSSNHGDHTAYDTTNGDRADLTGGWGITILPKSDQSATKEPGPNRLRDTPTVEELDDTPKGVSPPTRGESTRGPGGVRGGGSVTGKARRGVKGGSRGWGGRGEVAVDPHNVLIAPTSMVSGGAARQATGTDLIKDVARELRRGSVRRRGEGGEGVKWGGR